MLNGRDLNVKRITVDIFINNSSVHCNNKNRSTDTGVPVSCEILKPGSIEACKGRITKIIFLSSSRYIDKQQPNSAVPTL